MAPVPAETIFCTNVSTASIFSAFLTCARIAHVSRPIPSFPKMPTSINCLVSIETTSESIDQSDVGGIPACGETSVQNLVCVL